MVLEGRRLGLLGLGKLGARMARIGAAFGMQVAAWSPNLTRERAAAAGATLLGKDELFESCGRAEHPPGAGRAHARPGRRGASSRA